MKLSEILKWEKKESEHINCYQFDDNFCFKHQDCFDEEVEGMHPLSKQGYNTALTSCDREIDREALAEILKECSLCHLAFSHVGECEKQVIELRDLIISTMPTWLKRIEK